MTRGVDYAWGRPSVAALQGEGIQFACRYLSYDQTGKNLTRAEADTLRGAGISPVSNWEAAGSWAEFSGGYDTGRQHALEAQRQHLACGGPDGRPIYFSSDWDVQDWQMATVGEYYRGVASVIGVGRTGAYGGIRTIRWLFDAGLIAWGWQTYAWSGGQWDPRAQVRQVRNGVYIDGVDCDIDEAQAADFGQWDTTGLDDMTREEMYDIIAGVCLGATSEGFVAEKAPVSHRQAGQFSMRSIAALLAANEAADATRDAALLATVKAIAGDGGPDAAPIVAAIREQGEATRQAVLAAHAADREREAAAAQAEADALKG